MRIKLKHMPLGKIAESLESGVFTNVYADQRTFAITANSAPNALSE